MAELDARSDERVQRRVYPLVWFVVAGIAALIGFAARQDNWPVVTHLLAGLLGMVSGVGIGQYRNRQSEPQPADE